MTSSVLVPGLRVGDTAPDFTLPGIDGGVERSWTLSELRGQPVVLVFYPGDGTPVCTQQLVTSTDEIAAFADVGAQVLAMSPQSVDSHRQFAADNGGFAFPLLADEDNAVAEAYEAWTEKSMYGRTYMGILRSWFRIDEKWRIAEAWNKGSPKDTTINAPRSLAG